MQFQLLFPAYFHWMNYFGQTSTFITAFITHAPQSTSVLCTAAEPHIM